MNDQILIRHDTEPFSEVRPLWGDRTAVVIAGGPSLTYAQIAHVAQAKDHVGVIAVNDAYLVAPWADVCYFGDSRWWEWHTVGIPKPKLKLTAEQVKLRFAAFAGQKCSIQHSGDHILDPAVHKLRNLHYPTLGCGLSLDPGALVTGKNSGFAAINLAILSGAKKLVLLGFDGRRDAAGDKHWHGEHPKHSTDQVFEEMRKSFAIAEEAIAKTGVQVFNCAPGSAIDHFPKVRLEEALA